ncbi:MAG: type II secretion system protein [Planctomycetaceae bacterium]
MLVVLAIVVILFSLAFRVLSASMENARTEATRATIRHLDSALQDRLEDFERINFKPLATRFKAIYDGYNPGADLPMEVAVLMVKKDRFRGSFPQREEDMYGFDGTLGGGITGDEAPLLMSMWNPSSSAWKPDSWAAKNSAVTGELAEAAESSELLYVALKNGSIFGPPHPGLDRIPSRHIGDTDNDGNLEFLDDWGHPLRFYNWSTRLFRPVSGANREPASIDQMMFRHVGVLPDVIPVQSSDPMVPIGRCCPPTSRIPSTRIRTT